MSYNFCIYAVVLWCSCNELMQRRPCPSVCPYVAFGEPLYGFQWNFTRNCNNWDRPKLLNFNFLRMLIKIRPTRAPIQNRCKHSNQYESESPQELKPRFVLVVQITYLGNVRAACSSASCTFPFLIYAALQTFLQFARLGTFYIWFRRRNHVAVTISSGIIQW